MSEQETGADVALEVGGQKINVRNIKSLNTGMTIATFIVLVCAVVIGWQMFDAHAKDTKETNNATVSAVKDIAKAQRETGKELVKELRTLRCVMVSEQRDRSRAEDNCERLFR